MADVADRAGLNELTRLLQLRHIAVGQVDHVDEAGGFRRIGHLFCLWVVLGQRLFAEDVLLRGDQLHCGGVVDWIGRHIGRRVELAPGDGVIERGEGLLHPVLR